METNKPVWEKSLVETSQSYLMAGGTTAPTEGVMWAEPTAASVHWAAWQADLTTNSADGWGITAALTACPGFHTDSGDSSDGTSSMTSSGSGNDVIDMSDLQPMNDAQAS